MGRQETNTEFLWTSPGKETTWRKLIDS